MVHNIKLAFVGGGEMVQAMLTGLIANGCSCTRLRVADHDNQNRQEVFNKFGVSIFDENRPAVAPADVVVLAVKPGSIITVLEEITPVLSSSALVISIVAGVTLATLTRSLPAGQSIVRAMPNASALVRKGTTVMMTSPAVRAGHTTLAKVVLASIGQVIVVTDESLIDGVTVISNSKPVYL